MDKYEFQERVFDSDLNQSAKLVLLAYLHHCKQTELKEVWPSYSKIAKYAGISRETAGKTAELLAQAGWLSKGSTHADNVQGYNFDGTAVERIDNLTKKKRNMAVESIDNLKHVKRKPVVDSKSSVVDSVTVRLSNGSTPVVDTVSTGKEEKIQPMEKTKEKGAVSAPVLPEGSNLPLDISTSSSDLPLEVPTGADARPLEVEEDEVEVIWETDEEALEAPERFPASKETRKESEGRTENPRPLLDPSEVVSKAVIYAERRVGATKKQFVETVLQNAPGWTGTVDDLLRHTQDTYLGEPW
jgi:DNA-binding GntR family transcriptional regulator